jgi:hypothetical protein
MADPALTAKDYGPDDLEFVKRTLLTIATILGDEMADNIVIVGGLVPSLLIENLPNGTEPHVGTRDIDLGLSVVLLNDEQYKGVSGRLREQGFEPAIDPDSQKPLKWKWTLKANKKVEIDFLIAKSTPPDPKKARKEEGKDIRVRHLEDDWSALIVEGIDLALTDCVKRRLKGKTLSDVKADRDINVAGLAAYFVLKALAHHGRATPKDAYDLTYVVQNYSPDLQDVANYLLRHQEHPSMPRAIDIVRREFTTIEHEGPVRVARFMDRADDEDLRQEVVNIFSQLLELLDHELGQSVEPEGNVDD